MKEISQKNNDIDYIKQEDEKEQKRQNSVDLSATDFGNLIHDIRQSGNKKTKITDNSSSIEEHKEEDSKLSLGFVNWRSEQVFPKQ